MGLLDLGDVGSPSFEAQLTENRTFKSSETTTISPQTSKLKVFAPQISKITRSPNTKVSSSSKPQQEPSSQPTVIPIQKDGIGQSSDGSDEESEGLFSQFSDLLLGGGIIAGTVVVLDGLDIINLF